MKSIKNDILRLLFFEFEKLPIDKKIIREYNKFIKLRKENYKCFIHREK